MSSIAFSTVIPLNGSQIAATGPTQPQPAPAPEEDTVKLSDAAQAINMYQAGDSVAQISSSLGTSTSIVDSYLGIATAIAVPTSVGHAGHSAPAKATPAPPAPAPAAPASTTVAAKTVAKS